MPKENYLKTELYDLIKKDDSLFNFIQEACLDGMWYWDLENPENEWMNERFWNVLGYDPMKMPATPEAWQFIINQDDLKIALDNFQKHLENENHPYEQTVRYTHNNGTIVWIRCNGKAIRDKDGKPIRMLGIHTIIRDQAKNLDLLNRKNTMLDIVNKLQQTFLSETTSNEVFENALKILLDLTESEYGFIGEILQNSEGQPFLKTKAITNIAWNDATRKFFEENAPKGLEFTNLNTLFGVVLKTGESIIANQPSTHPNRGGLPEGHPPLNAFLGLPLLVGDKMVGMAGVSNRLGGYDENLIREIEPITTTLGRLIEAQQGKLAIAEKNERLIAIRKDVEDITNAVNASSLVSMTDITGKIVKVNLRFCELSGYSEAELLGQDHRIINSHYHDETFWRNMWQTISSGQLWRGEIKNRAKNGNEYWVSTVINPIFDKDGVITHFLSIRQDITDRKRAELSLKQFNDIAENIQLGIYVYHLENIEDDRTLRLTYANPATEKMTGIKVKEIIGKTLDENFPFLRAMNIPQRYAEVIRTQEQRNFEDVLYSDDRISQSVFSVKAFPLPNNYIGIAFENITESKLIAESLVIAKEEAEKANKAKSEFLANMSHEIRTPLNAVIGFTELLKNTPLSAMQQQYVDIANVSGHTLLGVINGILDFSKIESGMLQLEMIKTDMIELAEHCFDIVKYSAIKKNLIVLLDIDLSMPRFCITDPFRLKQVIMNLLNNAVKFTKQGEVKFTVKFEKISNEKGKYYFAVRDTGIGITDEQKNKLFKAFSQADTSTTREFGGTGLGLVISEMIMSRLNSKIHFESKYGDGSTFWFELVTLTEEGEELQISSHKQNQIIPETVFPSKEVSILIVDDDPININLLEAMLRKIVPSAKYTEASTGLEGLEKFKQIHPDIIFMDMQMPEMGGLEATSEIRKLEKNSNKQVPIIAFTAGAFKADEEKCLRAGMNYFLTKPAKLENITFVVSKYLFSEES